ncbi:hypothetical protein K439DRAFT_1348195 [Ramaria rubella]|nr:hypothetical protein K439DRAFT_1348195 [Ramaria rubella]
MSFLFKQPRLSRSLINPHHLTYQLCHAQSSEAGIEPPPTGGHLLSVATSKLLRNTQVSLHTPGIHWIDKVAFGSQDVRPSGRETCKMNMYQAIRDTMRSSHSKDDTAVVFGEDVGFGGVFHCTMGLTEEFGRECVFNTPLMEQRIAGFGIDLAEMGHKWTRMTTTWCCMPS